MAELINRPQYLNQLIQNKAIANRWVTLACAESVP